jgi:hypothetical protein
MSSSLPDDSEFEDEEELRTDIRIALELAINDTFEDGERREVTKTEEEKLTHFAILDLDLPLTYSWYLAGGHTIADANPDSRSPWEPGQAFGELRAQEFEYNERIQEFRNYFRTTEFIPGYTLRQVWFTDKFEFLRDYYRELAPEQYRDLYLHSLDLREKISTLNETINRESENASLSDFEATEPRSLLEASVENELRYLISEFHMDLTSIAELNQFKKPVVRGTDLIEQVLSKLTRINSTSVEQRLLIKNDIPEFYYYKVWKLPALAISASTATGPNADALHQKRLLELDGFDEILKSEIIDLQNQAHGVNLLPDINEPISEDSAKQKYLHSVIKETVDDR